MDATIFEKFNAQFDIEGLKNDEAKSGTTTEFVEVPKGDYEVSITKLELAESKKGLPQVKCWFKIVAGDFQGQLIFMNQNVTSGYGLHVCNEFLASLESGINIEFQDFVQYADMIESVFHAIESDEYQLAYGENAKGFSTYTIVKKFEK